MLMSEAFLPDPASRFPNPASRTPDPASRIPLPGPLRVLMLAPTPYFADRGCHVRIYEEARALIRLGHEVRIVTYHIGRDMPGIPTYRIPAVPWYKKLAAGPSWHKPYLDMILLCRALTAARLFKPDILHAHLHEGAFIGLFLRRLLSVPLVFDCQGSLTAEMLDHGFIRRGSMLYGLFRHLERFINRRADFIITSSGAGARELRENRGAGNDGVRGVMDGVDTDEFRPFPGEAARRELGLPLDKPVAVFLGVLNRYQGIDLLLEAIRMLKEAGVSLHFLIMGFPDGKYRQKAEEAGVGGSITFTGRIDYARAPVYLSAGDIAVSPKISLSEANGKLLNYMACGLPTVVFDTPVNREILGDTGVYARYGDAADFAARIADLIRDKPRMADLAGRVREKAERDHSWLARGKELAEIYRLVKDREAGKAGKREA
ncbi:MAG: group 1 glycosyl [Geobacteraceae bacterium]|nr:MAG: group 1 glycosyl [Geobacteraceae bacterium]